MNTSFIEISRSALQNNIAFIRKMLGEEVTLSVVVKGNAYGHGIGNVIPVFEEAGITHISVFSSGGARLAFRFKKPGTLLMIMGYINEEDYEWVISNNVSFFIIQPGTLKKAIETARKLNTKARIHIEIETGLHRTGLDKAQLEEVIELISANEEFISVEGAATHLAGAESVANHVRIMQQLKLFNKRLKWLEKKNIHPRYRHSASSAAAVTYPQSRMDLVRIGIMAYGFWPTKETFLQFIHNQKDRIDPLKRAICWKSSVMSVKKITEGEFVGYGFGFQAQQNLSVAIIPVGYSNGYSRQLSNNGHVLIRGQRADVIGSVNMNMIIVNISHIDGVIPGDEAVLLGIQGENEISVASFADMNNSLNYELLSRLPERIERVLV